MKKLIVLICLLNAVSGMAQSGWLNYAPGKNYGLWATKWLQADDHFYWKGDTIKHDSIVYVDIKPDSLRFRYIDGVYSKWYFSKDKNAALYKLIGDSTGTAGYTRRDRLASELAKKLPVNNPTATGLLTTPNLNISSFVNEGYGLFTTASGNIYASPVTSADVYKGTWNANTNTPTIADGTGTTGWYYDVVVAGTWNSITFNVNDRVKYNGTIWERIPAASITGAALTKTDDTNVTLTLGGSPSTALVNAASITVGWTGTLADGRIASASTWNAKAPGSGSANYVNVSPASAQSGNIWMDGYLRSTSMRANGRIYSISDSNYDDLATTNGSISMAYDATNNIGNIISRNYASSLNMPMQFQASEYIFLSGAIQATTAKFTNLTDGYIPYHISDASGMGNSPIWTDGTKVGIGTNAPNQQLEITGNFRLPSTTHANQFGIIYKDGNRFIHDFNYGDNGTVTTTGHNLFIGESAGNFTMGSTATNAGFASGNLGIGYQSLFSLTNGYNNLGIGYYSLHDNTSGAYNSAIGYTAMWNNTTGLNNVGIGYRSLYKNTTGGNNLSIGNNAGAFIANGTTANLTGDYNIFMGGETKALADNDQNEIVIGYNTIGNGSNTATIGNSSLLRTYLTGINLKAGTAAAGTAPLKFTTGVNLTAPEVGAMEFDGTNLYFTPVSIRKTVAFTSDIPTNLNQLTNGPGYITGYTETDPTVYSWAKASTKPTYGWTEITDKPSTFAPSAHTLDSHSNVTITSNTSGELLKWNGTAWINNTLSEAGIEAAFSKNTAFNKNFGSTTGTVLEGRTFGTAANNNTGDFATAGHNHSGTYEPVLGNPSVSGYVLSSTTGGVRSWVSQTGGMVYPGAGIPISTGSAWGTSITNNSSNWNTAYSNMGKIYDGSGYATLNTSHFYMGAGYIGLQMGSISSGNADPVSGGDVYTALAGKAALAGSLSQAFNAASLTIEAGTYDWAITNSAGSLNFGQYSTNITFSSAGITTPGVNLSGETASTLASFDASKNVKSLSTATYPSLTEVSYVKGVSSSIQTQLNAKVSGSGTSGRVAYWDGTSSISSDADLTFDGTNLVVGGNITGAEVYRGSSRTLKKNIHIYRGSAMDILNKTPIYTYNLKSNNSFGIGFIAEETDKWLSGEDKKAHLMGNHLGIITKALQEKDDEIQELKSRVERLEKIVNQIKRRK